MPPRKLLFIVDPLDRLNVKTDTTLALVQEASSRGLECFACELIDIALQEGKAHFLAAPIFLNQGYENPPHYLEPKRLRSSDEFSAIFMRKDPPVDELFFSSLLMLRCYDPLKTLMINDPEGLLIANEKLFGQHIAHQFFPKTIVSGTQKIIQDFIKAEGRVVLKPLFGSGGSGVLVFEAGDLNLNSALELLTENFTKPIMVQAYIKNARQGDKRILLLGGEPLGAVLRVPKSSDHRANFHAGGSAEKTLLSEREHHIVKSLKPHLVKWGLHFVGIDVIDGYLTEINVTSPTCVLEMEALGGHNLRAQVLDYALGRMAS